MRDWLYWIFIVCLLAPVQSYAWMYPVLLGGGVAGISYEFYSGFETSADRTQWYVDTVTVTLDYSSSGLSMTGDYVAYVTGNYNANAQAPLSSSYSEGSAVFQIRVPNNSSDRLYFGLMEDPNNGNATCMMRLYNTGTPGIQATDGSDYSSVTAFTFSDDTTYWARVYAKNAGTGSCECETGVWNGSSWTTSGFTDGDDANNINELQIRRQGLNVYYDEVFFFDYKFTGDPTTLSGTSLVCSNSADHCSDFEDAGDRDQWDLSGTGDLDHSSSGLNMTGSYVARLDSNGKIDIDVGSSTDDLYVVFQMRYEDALENSELPFRILSNTDFILCYGQFTSSGSVNVYTGGSYGSAIGSAHQADETKWWKFWYEPDTGGNTDCGIGYWNGSSWTTTEKTDSSMTGAADGFALQNTQDGFGTEYWYADEFYFFDTDFTGDPTTF